MIRKIHQPSDEEFDDLVRCAREAYNEGRWVSYPAIHAWQVVVRSILERRAYQQSAEIEELCILHGNQGEQGESDVS